MARKIGQSPRDNIRRLWLICAWLILITLLSGVAIAWHQRQLAFTNAERELANLGIVLAEQTTRTIQSVDLVLQEVVSRVSASDIRSNEALHTAFSDEKTRQFLMTRLGNLPQADAIVIINTVLLQSSGRRMMSLSRRRFRAQAGIGRR